MSGQCIVKLLNPVLNMQIERRNQLLSLEQSRCHAIQHFLDRESSSDTLSRYLVGATHCLCNRTTCCLSRLQRSKRKYGVLGWKIGGYWSGMIKWLKLTAFPLFLLEATIKLVNSVVELKVIFGLSTAMTLRIRKICDDLWSAHKLCARPASLSLPLSSRWHFNLART